MMCTTMLHGGVCNRTSTPHKIGNKMKEGEEEEEDEAHCMPNLVLPLVSLV